MQRWVKLALSMKEQGIDEIVVASQHAVRYLSGYSPDLEIGPNAMDPGPAVLRIERDGDALAGVMLLPGGAESAVTAGWIACIGYDNYDVQTPGFDRLAAYRSGLAAWAQGRRGSGRKTAAEGGFLPLAAGAALGLDTGADDCTPLLNRVRQVKDEDEWQALRAAAQLANVGQHAVRRFALEGVSEIECYGQVKAAIEQAAGKRLPLLVDFVSGARTADIGGYPSDRKLQAGDLLLTDLVPHLDGYWGDSCSVMAIGTYTARQLEVRKHVKEALELAKASIKPGASVAGTDRVVRDYLARYGLSFPHHTGHGLGVQCHEAPLISMNGDAAYEENMVIALEPGAYLAEEGFGIRLEDVGRVTANGFEQWTQYE